MIVSKKIFVPLCGNTIKYYEKLGYKIPRVKKYHNRNSLFVIRGTKIKVKVSDLPTHSNMKILCKCEICGKIRKLSYEKYHKICHMCAVEKQKGKNNPNYRNGDKIRGNKNPFWNPNLTDKDRIGYRCSDIKKWKIKVKEFYNYTCCFCGVKGKLNDNYTIAHHINNYSKFPKQRFKIKNGLCLCKKCHILFHKIFGKFTQRKHLKLYKGIINEL